MMDTKAAGLDLATIAGTIGAGIQVYATAPDKPEAPCVFPEGWEADFTDEQVTLGGNTGLYTFTLTVVIGRGDDAQSREDQSVYAKAAVEALYESSDDSAHFTDLVVTAARAPADYREYGGTSYVVAEIDVQVYG